MKILLCGYMGAGKSYWVEKWSGGKIPCLDLDSYIEKRHGPIPQIFSEQGEPLFRRYEGECLAELLEADEHALIALGGGALTSSLIERVKGEPRSFCLVWLNTPLDICLARIAKTDRPKAKLSREEHQALWNERYKLYQQADYAVTEEELESYKTVEDLFLKIDHIMMG